jgi:hypothetical protein
MRMLSVPLTLAVALAPLLDLLGGGPAPARAQENGGTVTIYATACPLDYAGSDYYADCFGNPVAGLPFSAAQGKSGDPPVVAETGADGFVTLPLFGGVTLLSEGLPAGIVDYYVYCSRDDGQTYVEVEYTADTFGILLDEEGGDYAPGDDLRCDWYNVPVPSGSVQSPGTVTIYRAVCPPGYGGSSYTDYYDDCFGNSMAGAQFVIRADGSDVGAGFGTGPDGMTRAALPLESPGSVVVTETSAAGGAPIPYQDYVAFCIRDGSEEVAVDYGQRDVMDIVFEAEPDDAIWCDWFFVPPAGPGDPAAPADAGGTSLTISVTACPEGYDGDDLYFGCAGSPVEGVTFTAYRLKEDFFVSATTDATGAATLSIPPSPIYDGVEIVQSPGVEVEGGADPPFIVDCADESGAPVEVGYNLIQLDPGGDAYSAGIADLPAGDVRCDWYLLSPDDSDEVRVIQLPGES